MHWLLLILIIPYLYILFRIYIKLKKIKPFTPSVAPDIFVSIIVACHNEEKNLPVLLKRISAQDYSKDLFELLIVDDNSSDRTFSVASDFKGIRNLQILKNCGKGKKEAIRTGVVASSGNLIITTDADCTPGERWIMSIASYYIENKNEIIICPVRLESKSGFFNIFQQLEFLSLQGITAGTAASGNPVMCNGANLAFEKDVYLRHYNNQHPELVSGDDIFLLHSVKKESRGNNSWLESADAIVTTRSVESMKIFFTQRARWISKATAYDDRFTQLIAIVTFVTILLEMFLLIASVFNLKFLFLFLVLFIIKSVPDYLILRNTTARYRESNLMRWFFLSEVVYPIYVTGVICRWCRSSVAPALLKSWFSCPFPRGI